MDLAPFDSKRMALILENVSRQHVIRGTASYENDPQLGGILRIRPLAGPNRWDFSEFILQEATWQGEIVPDDHFGCDFYIDLSVA